MASGNPEKAAEDAVVKQVRAGIKAGKQAVLPLTPNTRITITTTNEDEAEFITRIVMANLNVGTDDEFPSYLHAMELYTTLYAMDDSRRPVVVKSLKRTLGSVLKMK